MCVGGCMVGGKESQADRHKVLVVFTVIPKCMVYMQSLCGFIQQYDMDSDSKVLEVSGSSKLSNSSQVNVKS